MIKRALQAGMLSAGLAAVLAGCSSPEEGAKAGLATATATASTATAAATGGPVAFADNSRKGTAVREFAYSWPAEISAVPALTQRFTAERDKLLAEQKNAVQLQIESMKHASMEHASMGHTPVDHADSDQRGDVPLLTPNEGEESYGE